MSKQTTTEMKAALDAFERDGVVEAQYTYAKDTSWKRTTNPIWDFMRVNYRPVPPKPEPRKPRECLIYYYGQDGRRDPWGGGYPMETDMGEGACREVLHMREVMPDEPQPVGRTPWFNLNECVYAAHQYIGRALNAATAKCLCDYHNRAIGIKEEQA